VSSSNLRGATLIDTGPFGRLVPSKSPMSHGIRCIATLDRRDFGVYRLPGGDLPTAYAAR
jgi:hypothetical protein